MKKIPFWCPNCKKIIEPLDYKYIEKYGVCGDCYINYIEGLLEEHTEEDIAGLLRLARNKEDVMDVLYVRKKLIESLHIPSEFANNTTEPETNLNS
jgi:hypothetical protein